MGDDVVPELNTQYVHVVLSSFVESELKKVLTFNIANEIIGQGLDLHMFSHISLYGYNNSFLCTDFGNNLSYTF